MNEIFKKNQRILINIFLKWNFLPKRFETFHLKFRSFEREDEIDFFFLRSCWPRLDAYMFNNLKHSLSCLNSELLRLNWMIQGIRLRKITHVIEILITISCNSFLINSLFISFFKSSSLFEANSWIICHLSEHTSPWSFHRCPAPHIRPGHRSKFEKYGWAILGSSLICSRFMFLIPL